MKNDSDNVALGDSYGAMDGEGFRAAGHALVEWIADYLEHADRYPVLAQVEPGDVRDSLTQSIPEEGESWERIWDDFEKQVMPGVTHWQSPNFFGYFPANVSFPSILGELLSAGLGVNGMLWSTSPAATELETLVLDLLVDAMKLPSCFKGAGVIQDTASSASLCAILCAREQTLGWQGNESGLSGFENMAVYVSDQVHSSIEKGAKIAGIGREFVRVIKSDEECAMSVDALEHAIKNDIANKIKPTMVSATLGTTSSLAVDPLRAIGEICKKYGMWFHVDGAMAGSALICPEYQAFSDGLEYADSYCFNPHKWLLTNFDCDVMYVREPERLVRTLSIMPEYLRAKQADDVINYRDWHVPLGRRFRALKLWFVLRSYGLSGLRSHIREHIRLAELFADMVKEDQRFELVSCHFNLVCFRVKGDDALNEAVLHRVNEAGKIFITHTKIGGRLVLRFCPAQTNTREKHVRGAWDEIIKQCEVLS